MVLMNLAVFAERVARDCNRHDATAKNLFYLVGGGIGNILQLDYALRNIASSSSGIAQKRDLDSDLVIRNFPDGALIKGYAKAVPFPKTAEFLVSTQMRCRYQGAEQFFEQDSKPGTHRKRDLQMRFLFPPFDEEPVPEGNERGRGNCSHPANGLPKTQPIRSMERRHA